MRWCRIRLILLGLTLCVVHVVSGCYDQKGKQLAASVKTSDIVLEAKLDSWKPDNDRDDALYLNMTVKKGPSKGMNLVKSFRQDNKLALRIFMDTQTKTCVEKINTKAKGTYFFLLKNDRTKSGLFELHSGPVKRSRSVLQVVKDNLSPSQPQVKPPTIVHMSKSVAVQLDKRLKLECKADGAPSPTVTWFKDGKPLSATKGRVKVKTSKPSASQPAVTKTLKISKLRKTDQGNYTCVANNTAGNDTKHVTVNVSGPVGVDKDPANTAANNTSNLITKPCASEGYCLNGGNCRIVVKLETMICQCSESWTGKRCEMLDIINMQDFFNRQAILQYQRTLIIIGIVIAVLVFIAICIASYVLSKYHIKRRRKTTTTAAPSVNSNAKEGPVITPFKELKDKKIESFSSIAQVNSKKELDQMKNNPMNSFPPVEKRNGSYPGPRQRLAANSYYDNNPDQSESIEMKPLEEANKTETVQESKSALGPHPEISLNVPITLSPRLYSHSPEVVQESEGKLNCKQNHLPICESKSEKDLARIGNHLSENSPLLNEMKMRQSQTCPKMNSPVNKDKLLVESSDSDEEMEIPYTKHDSLHISEELLFNSKENLDSSSGSGDLSPSRLARREDKVQGLLPSSNTARPAMRKYQSEEGPALGIQANKIHNLHLQDSIRSHSLDEPPALERGIHSSHLNSTLPGSPDEEYYMNPSRSQHHNHNSYDPNEDDVPWEGNKAGSFSQLNEEEMYRLNVLPNQQPIPI